MLLHVCDQSFMYFEHKHVETGPSCSHELDTFEISNFMLRALFVYNFQ